jgi:hypothetical protein
MTTLSDLQDELGRWQQHNFPGRADWEPLIGVQEEVGELSHAFLKRHQGIRSVTLDDVADAIGDIIVYLADFCNAYGLDLQESLDETWDKVKFRDWKPGASPKHPFADSPHWKDMSQAKTSGD